eukprot:1354301-Amorphochlora_amoeboformis.AAC.1
MVSRITRLQGLFRGPPSNVLSSQGGSVLSKWKMPMRLGVGIGAGMGLLGCSGALAEESDNKMAYRMLGEVYVGVCEVKRELVGDGVEIFVCVRLDFY